MSSSIRRNSERALFGAFLLSGLAVRGVAIGASEWENEQVLQINREPARATFVQDTVPVRPYALRFRLQPCRGGSDSAVAARARY
jgi:hypothetical protein